MIFLLTIFMVQTPSPHYRRWAVDLPHALFAKKQPSALREDAMRIAVSRDGKIYYQEMYLSVESLSGKLKESMRQGAEKKVYVAADARARYEDVANVLRQVSEARIQNVCFITN
jgi:biopolymer transport protein ExbD